MNVSNPVATELISVDFNQLTLEDVHGISVKQIVNPVTFAAAVPGSVPVPLPGGLYDPALGASEALRQRCSTCHLDHNHCPGHVGHIALPIPVYNPLFFDQLFRLLRGTCLYCYRFRLSKPEVERYALTLRLIQHGLLEESITVEQMRPKGKAKKSATAEEEGLGEDLVDDDEALEKFLRRRREFVKKAIRNKQEGGRDISIKTSAQVDARRRIVKDFLKELTPQRKCAHCQAYPHSWRADNCAKIFEKPLSTKRRNHNSQLGLRRANPTLDAKTKRGEKVHRDEGIAMDIEEQEATEGSSEEEETTTVAAAQKKDRLLTNMEVEGIMIRLFDNEQEMVQLLYQPRTVTKTSQKKRVTPSIFFMHAIAVPPTPFRPPQAAGGDLTESTSNKPLVKILQDCLAIRDHRQTPPEGYSYDPMQRLLQAFVDLQQDVNAYLDSTKSPIQGLAARSVEDGIKQKLEKKEGLFRNNMMGKRVNFAARSVISPDPNIETNEIGVPLVFATRLSYPEPVTDENYTKLAEYVKNGPDKWPGALSVEMENGTVQKLPSDSEYNAVKRREEIAKLLQTPDPLIGDAKPKKVNRHLMNNDYVLMNRQPTLHKPSMMAHKARVLKKERTIRMHYANCNTYNADFDGDEMNMHLPQNAIAQAEAQEIARTDLQYLVPTSGKPLRGLIQDHLVMGVQLTNRDTFFNREEYHQLLYSCLLPEQSGATFGGRNSSRIITIPPAIIKPRPLWTGKQVITTILENIKPKFFDGLTLTSRSKVPGSRWYPGNEEEEVIFHKGYLACGILDKNQLGPSDFGFIHSIYEVYGPSIAGQLLSIIGRLLTKLLHMRAHTCGMDDLVLTPEGNARRRKTLNKSKQVGRELSVEYVGLKEGEFREKELHTRLEEVLRDENKHRTLDLKANASTKNFTSTVIRECLPDGLVKSFPKNNFQAMTVSGAKGSDVNASQISCLLGQQVLEGRRVPVMVSGKTLPCFKPYETDVRAGGYVTDRFLTGVRPQEFYFHCMAGREGLIDTAVKTSRSGYLQRCLIKGMEGINVQYDNTVRDSDGSMVQFLYGEDALDVAKQRHLTQFKFCAQNIKSMLRRVTGDVINEDITPTMQHLAESLNYDQDVAMEVKKSFKRYRKKGDLAASAVTISEYNPARYLGSISEKFHESLEAYIARNPDQIIGKGKDMVGREMSAPMSKSEFRNLMALKYIRSVIDPGECVGIVAGQSIGEPSTQMTLNTFHLAGHATKNVTLGIPRLREIVMTASAKIGTPAMTLTLNSNVTDEEASNFVKRCNKLALSEIIDNISVEETTTASSKKYQVRVEFFPANEYRDEYSLSKSQVEHVLKTKFLRALENAINKALNPKKSKSKSVAASDDALPEVGESAGPSDIGTAAAGGRRADDSDAEDDDDDDDDDDGDATNAKARNRKAEQTGYEAPDEEEAEIVEREGSPEEGDGLHEDEGLGESEHSDEDEVPERSVAVDVPTASENVTSFMFDKKGEWVEIKLEYPAESPKVLMLGIVEKVCRETVIHQLPGIGGLAPVPSQELSADERAAGVKKLAVEGVNFPAMWDEHELIDMNTIETNDIARVLHVYGVEAARNNIIKEMNAVFGGHGISVDVRHLNLIADVMTRSGGYVPFNRQGMLSSTSPLMKMSFETTCNFLKDATMEGDLDDLANPSARIVTGKLSGVGTGSFDVLVGGLS